MELIKALGIDWRILLAQFFNFVVLVWILWKFAYKPVLSLLEERRLKVEKGLDDAESAAKNLAAAEEESRRLLLKTRQEASAIIEKAQVQAEERQKDVVKKAQEEIGEMMEKERGKIAAEKAASLASLKEELSAMIAAGLEKFFREGLDENRDNKIVARIAKEISK